MPPRTHHIAASALRVCPNTLTTTATTTTTTTTPIGPSRSLLIAFQSLAIHTSAPSCAQNQSKGAYNPYAIAKSKAARLRNVARQKELSEERDAAHVDPVVGNPTPFTQLLDSEPAPLPSIDTIARSRMTIGQLLAVEDKNRLNFFLKKDEMTEALKKSKELTIPPPPKGIPHSMLDRKTREQFAKDAHTVEAIKRITSLALGSSRDKTRENKQLCIETFGRHQTDKTLTPDPAQMHTLAAKLPKPFEKTPRVGRDTGSSEVQAAILTAKIRALAEHLETAKKDKVNKRNLRVLCHKRQKILRYLKRKEKGGVRYRNVMEQLGLDEHAIESELMM